jgi:hypothetical protein
MMIRQLKGTGPWFPQNMYMFQIVRSDGFVKKFLQGYRANQEYRQDPYWAGLQDKGSNLIYKDNT